MGAAYFSAAIPEPFRILGLRLKPLSLGRYLILRRFNCAFVDDEEAQAGIPDLLLGLVVCSMRVDEFLAAAESGTLQRDIRKWGRKVCPLAWVSLLPWVGKFWRKNHAGDALGKINLFRQYIARGSEIPAYWDEGASKRGIGGHWTQAVELTLRGELGWTKEEIDEQPLSKALWDYFKWLEGNGAIRLMSDQELKMIQEANRGA
jgi:hypothetical protein